MMPRVDHSSKLRRQCVNRVRAGHAIRLVAREVNICESTVYRWCLHDGVRSAFRFGGQRKYPMEIRATVLARVQHEPLARVARDVGVPQRTVRDWVAAA